MGKRKSRNEKKEIEEEDDCFRMQEQIVNLLREKVNRIEDELNYLRSHQKSLYEAWSTPAYPPGYIPGSWTASEGREERVIQAGQAVISKRPGQRERNAEKVFKAKRRKIQKITPAVNTSPLHSPEEHRSSVQKLKDSDSDSSRDSQDSSSESDVEDTKHSPLETVTTESAVRSESSSSEDSSSEDENVENGKSSESYSEDESSSESEDNEPQATRPNGANRNFPNFPRVNWANEPRKRRASRASSSSDSDSNDSDDSASVVEVTEEDVQEKCKQKTDSQKIPAKNRSEKKGVVSEKKGKGLSKTTPGITENTEGVESKKKNIKDSSKSAEATNAVIDSKGVGGSAALTSNVDKLSLDAPPEDIFDWNVLGVPGPWAQANSSSSYYETCQWPKQLTSLPCRFNSFDEYIARNQWLVFEECKALLDQTWEHLQRKDEPRQAAGVGSEDSDDNLESRIFHLRPMHRCADDSFNFFELSASDGRRFQIDTSEVLLLSFPKFPTMKVLACVSNSGDKSVLLKTRVDLQSYGSKCKIARMSNMVTLKRQFLALLNVKKLPHFLRQQILDPLSNNACIVSPPSDECLDENVPLPSGMNNTLLTWKEHGIFNNRQLLTMTALLQMKQGALLVQGPPGTGKTSTIVGMISAVCLEEPGAKVLVCAASNAAVDEIVSRLMYTMLDKEGKLYSPKLGTLVRVGVQKSVQVACQPVTMDALLSRCSKGSKGTAKTEILSEASIICSTLSGSGHPLFEEYKQKFDLIVLAAQALECETLIALQRAKGRVVIVGDPCQLPATVIQRPGTAYGRSLFQRMQQGGMQTFLMTTQYRMHPQISKYPSASFYGGCLKDSKSTQCMTSIFKQDACDNDISCDGYTFRLGPYCFLDVSWGEEELEATGHSISNVEEAEVVAKVVHGVVKSLRNGRKADIGVITPYLAQRTTILSSLLKYKIDDSVCEVNTVDGFQGREKDVIILSCVRAATEKGLGFVSDEKRMNVALTRAKHALIIVGHGKTLKSQSTSWSALLEDAMSRGCYQVLRNLGGAKKSLEKSSRVEPTAPGVSERAAKFHSAQTSPVKKQQAGSSKKPQPVPNQARFVPASVKVEPITCDFAHHFPNCGHNAHGGGQLPDSVDTVKRTRGAVRINGPNQHERGGTSRRGRFEGLSQDVGAAPPNRRAYFGHVPCENQHQKFAAPPQGYDDGRPFLEPHMLFAPHPGGGRDMDLGGHWHHTPGIANQVPPFFNPHANRSRR
ncbi:hypothetical protein Mapa_000216 [Marchantia paleacea]|nr:hypothetical protein Mapa_000216 [Marchantia paleacea]